MLLRTQCFSLYLGHAPRSTPEELSKSKRELKQKRIYRTCIYAQKMHSKCHLIWYSSVLLSNKWIGNSKNDKNPVLMMSRLGRWMQYYQHGPHAQEWNRRYKGIQLQNKIAVCIRIVSKMIIDFWWRKVVMKNNKIHERWWAQRHGARGRRSYE